MTCPLCNHKFEPGPASCPSSCPLHGGCKVICCPRCRYSFVEDSAIVNGFKRLLGRFKSPAQAAR